jgi:hypothetical protein
MKSRASRYKETQEEAGHPVRLPANSRGTANEWRAMKGPSPQATIPSTSLHLQRRSVRRRRGGVCGRGRSDGTELWRRCRPEGGHTGRDVRAVGRVHAVITRIGAPRRWRKRCAGIGRPTGQGALIIQILVPAPGARRRAGVLAVCIADQAL